MHSPLEAKGRPARALPSAPAVGQINLHCECSAQRHTRRHPRLIRTHLALYLPWVDHGAVRVTRLLITGLRGWERLDLRPDGHVLLAGVPRAGRTDIITALARVLDPHAARNPLLSDLHQECPAPDASENHALNTPPVGTTRVEYAEVEVTLTDFDPNVQQLFDGYLEPLDPSGQASEDLDADPTAPQCVRLTYRLTYDGAAETLEAIVYFPARSNPAVGQYARVPAATRRALPVITLKAGLPMQLRAAGNLRRVINERDPDTALAAFETLRDAVAGAVSTLSTDPAVTGAVDAVLSVGGAGTRLGDTAVTAAEIGFLTEDGSVGALLRTLRAAARLDAAGLLELASHGSTAIAVLSAAEAMLLASVPGAIVLADDFGDQLDAAAAEHLAALLRARSGQLWLSTRRPDAARAFEPGELVRLVRRDGVRAHYQLAKITDRKTLTAMRQLHTQLLAAVTAPNVAITEGPHDVAIYSMVDRRYPPDLLPLSAHGVRLVAAGTGQNGGIDQIPRVADLARRLGFRVLAVIDRDKDGVQAASQLAKIQAACDVVIRLPKGAIERAMLAGIDLDKIVAASATLTEYDIPDPVAGRADESAVTDLCKVIHKQGLHEQLLDALYTETAAHPPMIVAALTSVAVAANPRYSGPALIDLPDIPRPSMGTL